ncbi:MAG TPA: lipid II flippase MurJ [Blastocatellia bacterium]|nr:lipid II flippase MurJ [Blastocatellia bacterium]
MKKTTVAIMLLSALQMLASYAQRMVLAYFFGASSDMDKYFLCLTIPSTLVFFLKATGTSASPVGTKFEETDRVDASRKLWGGLFWLAILTLGIVTSLLVWRAGDLAHIAGQQTNEQLTRTTLILRILLISEFGMEGMSMLVSNLQILRGRFILSKITGLFPFISLITGVSILHSRLGVVSIAVSLAAGSTTAAIVDVWSVRKDLDFGMLRNLFKVKMPEGFSSVVRHSLPVMVLTLNGQVLTAADNVMATAIGAGALSVFTYAYGIFQIPQIIFTQASTLVKTPDLFKQAARGNYSLFAKNIYETMESTLFLVMPATLGLIILREPLIRLMLQHGSFKPETTAAVSHLLLYFAPVSILWAMWLCLGRPLIALQRASSVMRIEVVMTVLSIGLNYLLRPWLGLEGLVLSTILAMSFTVVGFLYVIQKEIKVLSIRTTIVIVLRTGAAALIMTAVCIIVKQVLVAGSVADIFVIGIVSTLGVIVYLFSSRLLHVEEATSITVNVRLLARRVLPWLPLRRIDPAPGGGDQI